MGKNRLYFSYRLNRPPKNPYRFIVLSLYRLKVCIGTAGTGTCSCGSSHILAYNNFFTSYIFLPLDPQVAFLLRQASPFGMPSGTFKTQSYSVPLGRDLNGDVYVQGNGR